jgi:hypothetical protein
MSKWGPSLVGLVLLVGLLLGLTSLLGSIAPSLTVLLKALCLVLVISDNAQVLIMCLRLYEAKDD